MQHPRHRNIHKDLALGEVSPQHWPCSGQLISDPCSRFGTLAIKMELGGALTLAMQLMAQSVALAGLFLENTCVAMGNKAT